jgi:hypothetical protein
VARHLQERVSSAHGILRSVGYHAAREEISQPDKGRLELIKMFQSDLGVR